MGASFSPQPCDCAPDGLMQHCTMLRVGSASSSLDAPIRSGLTSGMYSQMRLNWVNCPEDPGAVMSMLSAGLLDLALMFTEDAVALAAGGSGIRICGTFCSTPQQWGLYIPGNLYGRRAMSLADCRIGVPEGRSGVLMLSIFGEAPGWEMLPELQQTTFYSLRRAHDSLRHDFVRAAVWETRVAKPLVDIGEWTQMRQEAMPWASMLYVASTEALHAKTGVIKQFIRCTRSACVEFKERRRSNSQDAPSQNLSPDMLAWVGKMTWNSVAEVEVENLVRPLQCLKTMGLAPESAYDPMRLLAKEICTLIPGHGECHQRNMDSGFSPGVSAESKEDHRKLSSTLAAEPCSTTDVPTGSSLEQSDSLSGSSKPSSAASFDPCSLEADLLPAG